MKQLAPIFSLTFLSVLIISCSSSTDSGTGSNSVIGKWVDYKEVSIEENGTFEDVYNHEQNNYLYAYFWEFSDTLLTFHSYDEDGYSIFSLPYYLDEDSLSLVFAIFDTTTAFKLRYFFDNGMLVIESTNDGDEDEDDFETEIKRTYFKRYSGVIPPESWIQSSSLMPSRQLFDGSVKKVITNKFPKFQKK